MPMLALYRTLLHLYPAAYYDEYGEEMTNVFRQAETAARAGKLAIRALFYMREIPGLVSGAIREQLHRAFGVEGPMFSRRTDMRPEFRFPRSTVVWMSMVLFGIVLILVKAGSIRLEHGVSTDLMSVWPILPWALGGMLAIVLVGAGVVWGVLYSLHRTGVDRLENLQPWLEQK